MGRGTGSGRGRKPKDWELEEMLGYCGGQTQGHLAVVGDRVSLARAAQSLCREEGTSAHFMQPRGLPVAQMKFRVFVKKSPGA